MLTLCLFRSASLTPVGAVTSAGRAYHPLVATKAPALVSCKMGPFPPRSFPRPLLKGHQAHLAHWLGALACPGHLPTLSAVSGLWEVADTPHLYPDMGSARPAEASALVSRARMGPRARLCDEDWARGQELFLCPLRHQLASSPGLGSASPGLSVGFPATASACLCTFMGW